MKIKSSLLAICAVLAVSSSLSAAPITGFDAGNVGVAQTFGTVDSIDVSGVLGGDYVLPGGVNLGPPPTGTVDIDITSTNLDFGVTDPVDFTILTGVDPPLQFAPSRYQFNVTVTNDNQFGKDINQLDFRVGPGSISAVSFAQPALPLGPASNPIPGGNGDFVGKFHRISASHIRFGGLNGGGGELNFGDTTTVSFYVDVVRSNVPSTFTLNMVANPEPTSLALAGLGLFGFGGIMSRRRKKKALELENQKTEA